jgi:gliding motility-associated-like protein
MKIKLLHFFVFPFILFFLFALQVNAQVTASFTKNISAGCPPLNVSFTNTSTGATSYSWNFGNGNSSTATSPSAIFSTSGTFTVTLVATNGGGASSTTTATIKVDTIPVAGFTTSIMPSCPGQTITFTDNTVVGSGAITSWAWDFGDGNGQTTATGSVTHAYAAAGVFPVTLIVTDANGCTDNTIKSATVVAAPVATFTGNPISSCTPPLTVNFTDASTPAGALTYAWDFGDGNTSTSQNPSNTYNALGLYNVTLTVTNGACSNTKIKNNYIGIQNVVADFSVDNTAVCANQTVTFTDLSTPLSNTQLWDFGDGTTSALTNPTHIYAAAGTYNVTLTEGSAGCQDVITKNAFITVSPSPTVAFSANQTQGCSTPFNVVFSNTSTPGCTYTWDFGDGSAPFTTNSLANFNYTYGTPGSDSVTLSVTSANGCIIPLKKLNYIVIGDPHADFTSDVTQGCAPLLVNFNSSLSTSSDPITNYKWTFGNGSNASTASLNTTSTYNTLGLFTVKLVIQTSAGCKDSITKPSYIKTGIKPHANFSVVDPTVCFGTNAQFTDLSTGADSAYWQFDIAQGTFSTPAGAPMPYNPVTNLFPDTGTFFVRQIVYSNGCADTLKLNNIITILPPKPIFTYQLSCSSLFTVGFTNASIGADSIVWNFGDGSPVVSNVNTPSHTYATRGNKTVTLTAYNFATNCHSSIAQIFTIAQPIAHFTVAPNKGCYPLLVTLTNTSQDDNSVVWKFGDGNADLQLNSPTPPTLHIFSMPKLDTVKLVITDVNGCMDSTTNKVIVYGPAPDFNAASIAGCAPFPATLTDASVSDSTLVQWTWDFGDGSATQTLATPIVNHTYATPGFYSVTMTVTDKNGCVDFITKPNYMQPTFPFPSFVTDTFACRNQPIVFDATLSNVAAPATYAWNFGDGNTGTGVIATNAYTADNYYNVTLTVTDVNGCDSTIQQHVRIQHPTAAFSDSVLLIGCGVTNMQYTDHSTGLAITSWHWDFGDGASATQQNPMHTYTLPATYTVTLVTTNSVGCTDTIAQSVVVPGPSGTFSFTPTAGCPPLTVNFTAVSPTAISYTWDFGDGTVVTTATPTVQHTYPQDIIVTPVLLFGSLLPDGTTCTLTAPTAGQVTVVTVIPTVIEHVDTASGCYPLTVHFSDASTIPPTIPGDSINSWLWNFGDGSTSTLRNPPHTFANAGVYSVSLTVTTFGGCTNNNSATPLIITVHPYPIAAFSVNSANLELPYDELMCTNQSVGASTYIWNFGDGIGSSTMVNPQYLYSSIGVFNVRLVAVSSFGCPDTTYVPVTTNADVIFPNAFTPNNQGASGGYYTLFSLDNDIFFPYTSGVIDYKFSIFDRWGELVFESLDVKKGWDGYYKGKLCEEGVYVWKAYLKLNNGKVFEKNGDVTLLR